MGDRSLYDTKWQFTVAKLNKKLSLDIAVSVLLKTSDSETSNLYYNIPSRTWSHVECMSEAVMLTFSHPGKYSCSVV